MTTEVIIAGIVGFGAGVAVTLAGLTVLVWGLDRPDDPRWSFHWPLRPKGRRGVPRSGQRPPRHHDNGEH